MAVPGRNQTLFHCVFQLHYCVQSVVMQNCTGWASYAISPTHNGSTVLRLFECGNMIKIHNRMIFTRDCHIVYFSPGGWVHTCSCWLVSLVTKKYVYMCCSSICPLYRVWWSAMTTWHGRLVCVATSTDWQRYVNIATMTSLGVYFAQYSLLLWW